MVLAGLRGIAPPGGQSADPKGKGKENGQGSRQGKVSRFWPAAPGQPVELESAMEKLDARSLGWTLSWVQLGSEPELTLTN